jgi:hypothetical protein
MKKDQKSVKYDETKINLKKEDFPDQKSYKKEYDRLYSLATKERRKILYQEQKEYKQKQAREYRENNPEKNDKYNKKRNDKYYSDKETQKKAVVRGWKNADIRIFDDTFDKFYDTTHCESCNCELIKGKGTGKNKKVLDHDHFSGYPRHVVCHSCNIWRRGYDNRRMKLNLELYRYFHRI